MSEFHPSFPAFKIACYDPQALADRVTKAPFRVITDIDELRAGNYQDEGVIVPELDKREPLNATELASIAAPHDTRDALRLIRVPQRTYDFADRLERNSADFNEALGVATDMDVSFKKAPLGLPTTTINPEIGKYVGLHIDALARVPDPEQHMMGIICGPGERGVTLLPDINMSCIPQDMRHVLLPDERLQRREAIRQRAAQLQGKVVCYTLWLEGSGPTEDTYEAYANLQPRKIGHDGTTFKSFQPGSIQLMNTQLILPASFDSIV